MKSNLVILGLFALFAIASTNLAFASAPPLNYSTTFYSSYLQATASCAICTKIQINQTAPYGLVPGTPAFSNAYYPYRNGSTLYVYNISVLQAQPSMCVSVANNTVCGAGTHTIMVPNATVSPTLSSNLIAGNKLSFTYSIKQGSTVLYSGTTPSAVGNYVVQPAVNIPVPFNITFDAPSNDLNYTALDPTFSINNPPAAMTYTTGTVYQNTNTTSFLEIWATTNTFVQAYVGNSAANLKAVGNVIVNSTAYSANFMTYNNLGGSAVANVLYQNTNYETLYITFNIMPTNVISFALGPSNPPANIFQRTTFTSNAVFEKTIPYLWYYRTSSSNAVLATTFNAYGVNAFHPNGAIGMNSVLTMMIQPLDYFEFNSLNTQFVSENVIDHVPLNNTLTYVNNQLTVNALQLGSSLSFVSNALGVNSLATISVNAIVGTGTLNTIVVGTLVANVVTGTGTVNSLAFNSITSAGTITANTILGSGSVNTIIFGTHIANAIDGVGAINSLSIGTVNANAIYGSGTLNSLSIGTINANAVVGVGIGNSLSFNSITFNNLVGTSSGNSLTVNSITAQSYVGRGTNTITIGTLYASTYQNLPVSAITAANLGITVSCVAGSCALTNNGVLTFDTFNGFVIGVNSINGVANAITFNSLGGFSITNSVSGNYITGNAPSGGSSSYSAGTGLSLAGSVFSLLPLTSGTGISITSTNTVNLLPLTAGTDVAITSTNTVSLTSVVNAITFNGNFVGNNAVLANLYGNILGSNTVSFSTATGTTINAVTFNGNVIGNNALLSSLTTNAFYGLLTTAPVGLTNANTITCTTCLTTGSPYISSITATNGLLGTLSGTIETLGVLAGTGISNSITTNNLNISLSKLTINGVNGISSSASGYIWTIGPTSGSIGNSYLTGPLVTSLSTEYPLSSTNPSGVGAASYNLAYNAEQFGIPSDFLTINTNAPIITTSNGISLSYNSNGLAILSNSLANINATGSAGITYTATAPLFISPSHNIYLGYNAPFTTNAEGYLSENIGNGLAVNSIGYLVNTNTSSSSSFVFNAPLQNIGGTVYLNYASPLILNPANYLTSSNGFISIPSLGISRYSLSALILFCIGICLFVIVLLNIFQVINLWRGTFTGGIANMVLAFSVVILLAFSGFYTEIIASPGYTISIANVISTVAPISISSLPLASNTIFYAVIILFSIVSAVIGGIGLYFIIFMARENRRKRRERKAAE